MNSDTQNQHDDLTNPNDTASVWCSCHISYGRLLCTLYRNHGDPIYLFLGGGEAARADSLNSWHYSSSSSSSQQTCVFHLFTHFFSISWKLLRSSNEQSRARRCLIQRTHCLCSLLHVNPVCSRLRHLHVVHGLSYPLDRLSLRMTVNLCGVVCNLQRYSLHRMTVGDNSAGFTQHKKQFLDFNLISAVYCPYREWT